MRRHHSRRGGPGTGLDGDVSPTPERHNHGVIERLERPIGDDAGRPARPYRSVDTLAIMQRRGTITRRDAAGRRGFPRPLRDRAAGPVERV